MHKAIFTQILTLIMDSPISMKLLHIQYIGCPRNVNSQIALESFTGHQ